LCAAGRVRGRLLLQGSQLHPQVPLLLLLLPRMEPLLGATAMLPLQEALAPMPQVVLFAVPGMCSPTER